jgi:hypothetical protein
MTRSRLRVVAVPMAALALAPGAGRAAQEAPRLPPPASDAAHLAAGADETVTPPGLPPVGKWMIAPDGSIAHWLGEIYLGKRLREPINVILVDAAAQNADDAKQRMLAAAAAAGYPVRFGHSTGYRASIGGVLHDQLPAGRDDAFSDRFFALSNDHGRLFGPHPAGTLHVFIGAFSREAVHLFQVPEHAYASFNRARDDFAQRLDRSTGFKLSGWVDLANAVTGDAEITTGDHDGRAVVLHAEK